VVLARFFAHHPDLDERSLQLVRRWFWRAALVGPEIFRGNTTGAVRLLNRAIQPGDLEGSIQRLLELIPRSAVRVPDLKRFRSNEAATKLVLCSWWSLEPRSLSTGRPFEGADLAACIADGRTPVDAVQHVFSRAFVSREFSSWSANRVLYPAAADDEDLVPVEVLLNTKLSSLTRAEWQLALASHSISAEMLSDGVIDSFLERRQAALERQLDAFLRQRCEWEFEDTPPLDSLIIDDEDEARELSDDESSQY
jgi:hypothetical protein